MNLKDVTNHTHGIARRIDFAFGTIIPINGNLNNVVAVLPGDKKQFDVERPAHESLAFKEIIGHLRTKTLEAALRILQAGQNQ